MFFLFFLKWFSWKWVCAYLSLLGPDTAHRLLVKTKPDMECCYEQRKTVLLCKISGWLMSFLRNLRPQMSSAAHLFYIIIWYWWILVQCGRPYVPKMHLNQCFWPHCASTFMITDAFFFLFFFAHVPEHVKILQNSLSHAPFFLGMFKDRPRPVHHTWQPLFGILVPFL